MKEQLQEKDVQLQEKDVQLQEKDVQLQEKDVQLQEKDVQLQEKDVQLQEKDTQLQEKDTQLQDLEHKSVQDTLLGIIHFYYKLYLLYVVSKESELQKLVNERDSYIAQLTRKVNGKLSTNSTLYNV